MTYDMAINLNARLIHLYCIKSNFILYCVQVPDLERKIDQLEEDLNYLSARKDLRRLEDFITELSGAVLHPQVSGGPITARQRVT